MKTLSFENFQVGREGSKSLFDVHLSLSGGIHLFMAPNGFGKSTLLQTLAGMLPALSGDAFFQSDATSQRLVLRPEADVFYMPEYLQLPAFIYPHEWVSFVAEKPLQPPPSQDLEPWVEKFRLGPLMKRYLGRMSQGERRRVTWLGAALSQRPVLLLDEPFDGLDLYGIEAARSQLSAWKKEGRCVWVVTHQAGEVLDFADSLALIKDRRLDVSPWKTGTSLGQLRDLLKETYSP